MGRQHFAPVWFTTDQQLVALAAAYGNASLLKRLLGTFRFPAGTAHIQGALTPWMRIPIAFVSAGDLDIVDNAIEYCPRPYRLFGWRVRNIKDGTHFRLQRAEVLAVEAADFSSPVAGRFDIPFTRLRTTRADGLDNVLLCIGGRLSMKHIRTRSHQFRAALQAFAAAAVGNR